MAELAGTATRRAKDVVQEVGDRSRPEGLRGELRDAVRDAATDVLTPAVRRATTSAAKYAVARGPELVKDRVAPRLREAGGAGALVKGVASRGGGIAGAVGGIASSLGGKLGRGGKQGGEAPSGTGRGRRLPAQEFVDVGVDLQTAYDQFTQFEDWPQFMHRVERVEQRDETTLMFHENIWGVRRSWEADIVEQSPCERILWRSQDGPQTIGVVTFHRLGDRLTRVSVTMDFEPKGLFEKASSGMRIARRALRSDLMRFKAFIELHDEATGAWRGRIEDGAPVDGGPPSAQSEDGPVDEDEDEGYEAEEGEEPEASEEEDHEEEDRERSPRPRSRRPTPDRSGTAGSRRPAR